MRHLITKVILLLALVGAGYAHAWQGQVSVDYRVGDNESRMMAEQNAMEKLKIQAAAKVKTYVTREKELSGGDLTESIRTIGASLVRLSDIEKDMTLDDSDNMVLNVQASASVDNSALQDRIDAIMKDRSKQKALEELARENQKLRDRLQEAGESGSNASITEGLREQSEIYEELRKNSESVEKVFARGTLISMANQANSRLDEIKQNIRDNVFGAFSDATVSVEPGKVTQDGERYTIRLDLDSDLEWGQVLNQLSAHFEIDQEDTAGTLAYTQPEESEGADPVNVQAFEWLTQQDVFFVVEVDDYSKRFDLMNVTEEYGCGGILQPGTSAFDEAEDGHRLCLYDPVRRGTAYAVTDNRLDDPISITVPASVAEKATSIEARYVVEHN